MGKLSSLFVFLMFGASACASAEPEGVLRVGSRNLRCPKSDLATALNRTTPKVHEYVVACDFMYTRVHCTEKGCYPAEVKPPCIGDGPCFEEDPVTLRWRLPREARLDRPRETRARPQTRPAQEIR
jgi:hypothetical protein